MKICNVVNCDKAKFSKGKCRNHYMRDYRAANPEIIKKVNRRQYAKSKDKIKTGTKIYYENNRKTRTAQMREYNNKNRDKHLEWGKKHRKEKPYIYNASSSKRRSAKLKATPKWLTPEQLNEIKQIYKDCPKGHEVDHIVPLQGAIVSGLHVPWNLQYLPSDENRRKSNTLV